MAVTAPSSTGGVMTDVQALVRRAQANDRAAFGELYELYCPKIYSYIAYHLNGRSEAAEDLTEEVFMKALQNLNSFQFREVPFSSWLYRIAHNHLIDHVRSSKKQQQVALDDAEHLLFEKDKLDTRLDRQTLTAALAKITQDQRQIVLMRVVQGLSITETAKAVGKSEDSVKQLQSRGLKALKRVLEAQGGAVQ
jgi:RNA polymerase sigma-70 factor (ECF subfamily)